RRIWHVGDNELNSLGIGQTDSTGRCVYSALYDPDQLDEAVAELDERYLRDEGASHISWLGPGLRTMRASHTTRDWDRFTAAHAPGVVYIDHRPVGAGEIRGVDAVVAYQRAFVDVAPSHHMTLRRIFVGTGRAAIDELVSSTDEAGDVGASERVNYTIFVASPAGLITRMEQFGEHDFRAANARLAELSSLNPLDDNVAMDASRRWLSAMVEGDWDTVTDLMRPEYRLEDRRPMFGSVFPNREATLAWFRATRALDLTGGEIEAIAMRGQRLALYRRTFIAQGLELTSMCLIETDADGRAMRGDLYDPDQLDEAIIELEERFLAGEGAPHEPWLRASLAGRPQAHAERDWDALRTIYASDIVLVDHRPAGSGEYRGVDAVLDYHRAMVEVASTHRQIVRRQLGIINRVVLAELVSGSDEVEGDVGRYEVVSVLVTVHDPAGHPTRMERFELDQLDDAWARFDELAGEG
ncbi:MAG TPA: nuclear transport factor 2 family protein, partial [Acidimicrobiales bacterium]|nr:nuclear transport factor 2 family protein [Acidimicrobiales bacterium]